MFGCLCCRLRAQRTRTGWWVEKVLINPFLFLQTSPEGKNTQWSLSIINKVIIKLKLFLHLATPVSLSGPATMESAWMRFQSTDDKSFWTDRTRWRSDNSHTHTHSVTSWWDPLKDIWTLEIFRLPKAQSSPWVPISPSWFNWKSSLIGHWHRFCFCLTSGICPSHCLMFVQLYRN